MATRLGDNLTDGYRVTLKEFCRRFIRAAEQRWKKSHRNSEIFRKQYENWLEMLIGQAACNNNKPIEYFISPEPSTSSSVRAITKRFRKPFEDLGNKQKKRRSDEDKNRDQNELAYSTATLSKK